MTWSNPFLWPDEVRIRPILPGAGRGPRRGELTGNGAPIRAEVDDSQRLVRGVDGVQVPSSARVTVPIDTNAPLGSEVTIWPGTPRERVAVVIAVSYEKNPPPLGSQLVLSLQ